ncbi:MAG: RHS repeat-associated core domain-containing protein, partial [Nitrososphaera sp.]|nr:RHS repeat-associated core domain-containing protein [Nitrososphaera sp.]
SGVVVYRAEFDPHGQTMSEWASDGQTFKNSRKFTGYERDWATNLDNANARMLHFRCGRFMQPDPLGAAATDAANPQSLNRYSYVGNDPVNFVDPSGLLLESEDTIRIETWERGLWDIWFLWHYYFGWGSGSYYQPMVDGGDGGGGRVVGGGEVEKEKDPYAFVGCTLDAALNAGIGLLPGGGILQLILTDYMGININLFQGMMGKDSFISGPSDAIDSLKIGSAGYRDYAQTVFAAAGGEHKLKRVDDLVNRNSFKKLPDVKKLALQGKLESLTRLGKAAKVAPVIAQIFAAVGFLKDVYKCYSKYL